MIILSPEKQNMQGKYLDFKKAPSLCPNTILSPDLETGQKQIGVS